MDERRKSKRNHILFYLKVYDQKTKKQIGNVVDISEDGFMLIHKEPMETNKTFNVTMELPTEIDGFEEVDLQAHSIWCDKDINRDYYDTGFELMNIADKTSNIIQRSIRDYVFRE